MWLWPVRCFPGAAGVSVVLGRAGLGAAKLGLFVCLATSDRGATDDRQRMERIRVSQVETSSRPKTIGLLFAA